MGRYAGLKMLQQFLLVWIAVAAVPARVTLLAATPEWSAIPGLYRNQSYNVDGAGGAQRLMAPLTLFTNRTYSWGTERGQWAIQEGKLSLSDRPTWGAATISSDGRLIFEFSRDGKRFTVTMYRAGDAPPAPLTGASPPATLETNRYEFRLDHDPDGTGKFFLGREIARVMGHQGAAWLDRPEREQEEHPAMLMEGLKIRPGDRVADIGAGSGYLTERLARKVNPAGRVFAVDIQPEMLDLLTNKMARLDLGNVVPVLGTISDPKLPADTVDLALMVDVYHEFSHPYEMMEGIIKSLKPGGRVAFVEYRAEDPQVPIKPVHKMSEAQVRREMALHPLEWVETISILPRQHLIIFRETTER